MKSIPGLTALLIFCCLKSAAQGQTDSTVIEARDSTVSQDSAIGPSVNISPMFIGFVCNLRETNKVVVEWEVDSIAEGDYFVVERSNEGGAFDAIGAVRATPLDNHYELTDNGAPNGSNFYRIRYAGKEQRPVVYSLAKHINVIGEVDFKFYPNPVDKLFIVRTEHLIDIQILDAFGATRLSKRLQKGVQVINISSLERGTYVLRVADKESNRVVSSQLLKN